MNKVLIVACSDATAYDMAAYLMKYHMTLYGTSVGVEYYTYSDFRSDYLNHRTKIDDDTVVVGVVDNMYELDNRKREDNNAFYWDVRKRYKDLFDFMIIHDCFERVDVLEASRFNDNCLRNKEDAVARARVRLILKMYPNYKTIGKSASIMDISDL